MSAERYTWAAVKRKFLCQNLPLFALAALCWPIACWLDGDPASTVLLGEAWICSVLLANVGCLLLLRLAVCAHRRACAKRPEDPRG